VIIATGPLGRAVQAYGSHGYRLLLARGGAGMQAAWICAMRRALVGTIFAGILPHTLRQAAGIDGYTDTPLVAFAAGRPVAGDAEPSGAPVD
jgi:hypothetical protein